MCDMGTKAERRLGPCVRESHRIFPIREERTVISCVNQYLELQKALNETIA